MQGTLLKWIKEARKTYGACPPEFICPPMPNGAAIDDEYFMRPVMFLWDPIGQLNAKAWCPECDSPMMKDRQWDTTFFRVYGLSELCVLNSYDYVCRGSTGKGKHSRHAGNCNMDARSKAFFRIMQCKEVGLTLDLLYDVVHTVSAGTSFQSMEKAIRARYENTIADKLARSAILKRVTDQPVLLPWVPSPSYMERVQQQFPSQDLLRTAFLSYYDQHALFFTQSMASLLGTVLRIDHTFKSVMNVGFRDPADGRWVKQYSALFLALNGDGQVLCWQFCKNQRHTTVRPLLRRLAKRCAIEIVYTDQCCTDRKFLEEIFGPEVKVYLDTFHFKQRILRTVNSKHDNYYTLVRNLKELFVGGDWTRQQMLDHLDQWEELAREQGMWTPAVGKAVAAGRKHIALGCLDCHGAGTQANENCHMHCNRVIPKNRMAVQLAEALLACFLHAWNVQRQCDRKLPGNLIRMAHVAKAHGVELPETEERFGVVVPDHRRPPPTARYDPASMEEGPAEEGSPAPAEAQAAEDLDPIAIRQVDFRALLNDLHAGMPNLRGNVLDEPAHHIEGVQLLRMPGDGRCFYHTMANVLGQVGVDVDADAVQRAVITELLRN